MKTIKKEIRSHRRCPCGSRKKYRNCCGQVAQAASKNLEKMLTERNIAEQYHRQYFGYVREILSCHFNGRRHVFVGGVLVTSENPSYDWNTPADFLISHLKTTLGDDWFNQQVKLPINERHLIATWLLNATFTVHDEKAPVDSLRLNGSAFSALHLAYDLFVIANHGCLSDRKIANRLINDLKIMNNFNGARYEIFVFATLIRAGFHLKLHDQLDGTNGRVTECQATHIKSNAIIQIEAKTRNVKNVLGAPTGKKSKIRLYDKLRDAIEKDVKDPYIIFVDLNLEKFNVIEEEEKLNKVRGEYKKLEEKFSDKMPNIVCFTNIPYHYESGDPLSKNSAFGLVQSKNPRVKLENEAEILNAINNALQQHGYLPKEFDESKNFVEKFSK